MVSLCVCARARERERERERERKARARESVRDPLKASDCFTREGAREK
jgi:hypothetical protein